MEQVEILTLSVGSLSTNCYILIDCKTSLCLIIDPGDDADYIERIISDKRITPINIFATHGHFDHIMAGLELQLAYNIPFFINTDDIFLVNNMQSSVKHFLGYNADPSPKIDGNLSDGDILKIGTIDVKVIHTPGHTPGSVCFYLELERKLFTGDTLFAEGSVGRTDFSYGDSVALNKSLIKIFKLGNDIMILPGHGESSYIQDEKVYHKI